MNGAFNDIIGIEEAAGVGPAKPRQEFMVYKTSGLTDAQRFPVIYKSQYLIDC
jgi:hypothetical protein